MYKVVFIGGSGRSGSTLLDLTLGQASSAISLGELRRIWQEGLIENRPCGCGTRFRSCPFWQEVFQRAFGGMDAIDARRIRELQRRIDRIRYIPLLWADRPVSSVTRRAEEYGGYLQTLYSAVARVSRSSLLIDSTKDPSHGHIISRLADSQVYCVHLVRDPRGVAHSRQRRKFNPASGGEMDRQSVWRSTTDWLVNNALVLLLSRRDLPYVRIRYEDFARAPAATIDRILAFLGESRNIDPLLLSGELRLGVNHTVSGNPLRYERGRVTIEPDMEWREE